MEVDTANQPYNLQSKVHDSIGYGKDGHKFTNQPFYDIHNQSKQNSRPFADIFNQDMPAGRPFPNQHSEELLLHRPYTDKHGQISPNGRPLDSHGQDISSRLYSDSHGRNEHTGRLYSDGHSPNISYTRPYSDRHSPVASLNSDNRPVSDGEDQEKPGMFSENYKDELSIERSYNTDQKHGLTSPKLVAESENQETPTLKTFDNEQEKATQRRLLDAYNPERKVFPDMITEEKRSHPQFSDEHDEENAETHNKDDNIFKEEAKKCQDNVDDLRAAINRADTVSPQVADVVEKVMSEDSSLVENQESYNLSNASFHDTNSNSSDTPSDYISSHVTSDSTTTYVRDPNTGQITTIKPDKEGLYFCHLCSFSGRTQVEFENHMTCHFEHICPHCDYKSRTEGRLKRHIKDFHTDDPPDGFGSKRNMGRPKVFRCKQCDFSATEKTEFWAHARAHIKDDKVLQCPRCPFVTEYKHHLEYHLRNHFGSKPFKCNKCNYSCVNKSMLNSHMKSHTNVYQYRCADCTYATKYCHSLKLHLRKYNHKPATVLNTDGSLPQGIDADASGLSLLQKRGPPRGPRGPRKDKFDPFMNSMYNLPQSPLHGLPPGAMMSPYWPLLSQFPNGFPHRPPPLIPTSLNSPLNSLNSHQLPQHLSKMAAPKTPIKSENSNSHPFKCNFCCYGSDSKPELYKHLMKVHATENQDLFSMFGLSSESLLEEQNRRMSMIKNRMDETSPDTSLNDELHVQTDGEDDDQKLSPRSWSHPSPVEAAKINRNSSRYSMPELPLSYQRNGTTSQKEYEGEDIIQQMMSKFGSASPLGTPQQKTPNQRESPLDLTKRKYPFSSSPISQDLFQREANNDGDNHSSGESTSANENNGQSPRKRSRKGKAFKLDRLCLQLHDKQAEPEFDSENDESEFPEENPDDMGQLQIDESKDFVDGENLRLTNVDNKKDEDIEEIKNSLQYLNEGMSTTQADKLSKSKSPDSTRNFYSENGSQDENKSAIGTSVISHTGGSDQKESVMQTHESLRRETELACWKMLQNGSIGQMPYRPSEQNGHSKDLAKLSTAAQHMLALNNKQNGPNGKYECPYCEIAFKDCVMYTMHMGYHGYKDPFKCNMCGHGSKDKVDFFLHIARTAHN